MRKQTKLVAVLSAAALLAIGASMTSFAAQGWQEENGTWVYYDKDGYQVSDQWAKSGNNWFYLNSDGEMATDTIIEDDDTVYYVDANGAMVANQWVQVENEDSYGDDDPDYFWYYFQSNGKAYKAPTSGKTSFKSINGKKYAFDSEGKMLYGWVNTESERQTSEDAWTNGTYFCGDENDGAQASGWALISVVDDSQEEPDQDYYFYFDTNGKKVAGKDNGELKSKTINGLKYSFDVNGKMVSEWAMPKPVATGAEASISSYHYFNLPEQGWRAKGWFNVVPQEKVNDTAFEDGSSKWYYAESDGDIVKSEIKTINSKKYAFNAKGEMLSGVQALAMDGNSKILGSNGIGDADKVDALRNGTLTVESYANSKVKYGISDTSDTVDVYVYYFGAGSDGSMKTGNQNIEIDGDVYAFSFGKSGSKKGRGLNETKDTLYVNGLRIKADSDMRYQVFANGSMLEEPADGLAYKNKTYVVNTSGSIMKNKKNLKDTDDMYICTDKDGHLQSYSEIKCGTKPDKDGKGGYTCDFHK